MYKYLYLFFTSFILITSTTILNGCSKKQADLSALAEEPPRTTNQYKFKSTDSDITAGIRIPYKVIKSAITKGLTDFETIPLQGTVDCSFDKEVKLGPLKKTIRIPCSSSYEGLLHIEQSGEISVVNKNNKFLLTAPVRVFGTVGLRGKTAQKLGLKNKKVDAAITINIALDVGLKTDWNAFANVDIKYQWNSSPRIEIIKGKHITFRKQADKFISKKLTELPQLINTQLDNLDLKSTVSKSWKAYSIPLKDLPIEEKVNISIIPKQAIISNIKYNSDSLTLAVGLKIKTGLHLGKEPLKRNISPPMLKKIKASNPAFKLYLPVHVDFDVIEKQIRKAINGKTFKQKTDVGTINIQIEDVFVYPSNNKIAIGVKFNTNLDDENLKTSGKLFLISKPKLNKAGTTLRLTAVEFSRDFNNALLNAITYVFKTNINTLIESKAQFDLTKSIQKTLKTLKTELSKSQNKSKFKILLNKPKLRLSQVVVGSKQLIIESKLSGFVNIQLNGMP